MVKPKSLFIQLFSIHGLIRGENLELGRDADTGGQTKYVVELARALSDNPGVDRVELITRQVSGKNVSPDYARPAEQIAERAYIIRIPCGPQRYLKKENLWPYLDSFVDQTLQHILQHRRIPDIIHGHYADAGYVGSQLARLLGVPFVFTGHSLGRVKRKRLLANGAAKEAVDGRYNFKQRIEAEETALNTAALVVASTNQEVEQQYKIYDYYETSRMEVIAPGVDLRRFLPPKSDIVDCPIAAEVSRFLRDPDKPMVLAIARPDVRKNFPALIKAYAEHEGLRRQANLVLVAGNRERFASLPPAQRKVLRGILGLIDEYDLYGSVAFPKNHTAEDVPDLYRLAAYTKGVFVNPALTEPFGLTLIEAAACGLPLVATNDGGPRDIIGTCKNGFLVDALSPKEIAKAVYQVIDSTNRWQTWSSNGVSLTKKHFSWESHVGHYLRVVRGVLKRSRENIISRSLSRKERIPKIDRVLLTSIDDVLTGVPEAAPSLASRLKRERRRVAFAVATGRSFDDAIAILQDLNLPHPDIIIARVGTEVYYGTNRVLDLSWQHHIDYHWHRDSVLRAMRGFRGLKLQEDSEQSRFKVSYVISRSTGIEKSRVMKHLRQRALRVNVVCSHEAYVDIVPLRASAGHAIRFLSIKWKLPPERILVAGYSGSEQDMLSGNTLGVVVGKHSPELAELQGRPRVYFAKKAAVGGLLEGIKYYDFFGSIRVPGEDG
jgi:sucrose-phosphate synthase